MTSHHGSSSRVSRIAIGLAACLITTVLFGAVVLGLTGEHPFVQLAHADAHVDIET